MRLIFKPNVTLFWPSWTIAVYVCSEWLASLVQNSWGKSETWPIMVAVTPFNTCTGCQSWRSWNSERTSCRTFQRKSHTAIHLLKLTCAYTANMFVCTHTYNWPDSVLGSVESSQQPSKLHVDETVSFSMSHMLLCIAYGDWGTLNNCTLLERALCILLPHQVYLPELRGFCVLYNRCKV